MPATSPIGIPYPLAADNNDTATSMLNLANWLDPVIEGSYTSAEIAALSGVQLWPGRRVWDSTRSCYRDYIGGQWVDDLVMNFNPQPAAYTLALSDANGTVVRMNSATAITLSVPTNAVVPFAVGIPIPILQYGAGQVTVAAVTPGTTTIRATPGLRLRAQYSTAQLLKLATDEWLLSGDVVA
jgi:hypothetical protein